VEWRIAPHECEHIPSEIEMTNSYCHVLSDFHPTNHCHHIPSKIEPNKDVTVIHLVKSQTDVINSFL
jgi:hypothetical protein